MEDTRFIKSIRLRNLLSFGPESEPVDLKPLNVLIGPNASGKSNFIDAISVIQSMPRDISTPFRMGGSFRNWLWKGKSGIESLEIKLEISLKGLKRLDLAVTHEVTLSIGDELVIKEIINDSDSNNEDDFYYRLEKGTQHLKVETGKKSLSATLNRVNFNRNQSVLSQYKGDISFPVISKIGVLYDSIKVYKPFLYGQNLLKPSEADLIGDFLLESLNNFAIIVNNLKDRREIADVLKEKMQIFYQRFDGIKTDIIGGSILFSFYEKELKEPIPASRLSDGTLRYLCLLLILCHPSPPPLICIEEPEVGLHPDILHTVAELLVEASKRTQLIVTTHSDILVSALSEQPESILVCDHDEQGTHMTRLDQKKLKKWLEKYSLGELWLNGQLGGTRW